MKGYSTIPDYANHVTVLLIFGMGFILFGAFFMYLLNQLVEFRVRYDNKTGCVLGGYCKIKIEIPKQMT